MPKYTKAEVEESTKALLDELKHGDVVYCELVHVARSGMQRVIQLHRFFDVDKHGRVNRRVLGYHAARVLGWSFKQMARGGEGVVVNGTGMDMGFHLVYSLGYRLFGRGVKQRVVRGRNGEKWETEGGYLLRHDWL
jgi:hypothetical protein